MSQIHDLSVPQEVPSVVKLQQRGFVLARTEFKEQGLVWKSERCPLPHNPWKALGDVSSPEWTREMCLEGNREGCLQALLHLRLINSETSFFRLLKITSSSSK